eukprot:TRINITY_DN16782_c0_g1_i1.p2 TRINITY_DN16782_c0_g1~~TRINITY_DN16782_c0_g1_i1.p2  ORF type:complete len:169 (+),score=54.50 TRINITY_DN16782_c0_g1_i1:65-571(+)
MCIRDRYSDTAGTTGQTFASAEVTISLKGKGEEFHEIDSPGTHTNVKNFMFVPSYGFNGQKNGVIQLFNKLQGQPREEDAEKMKPYQQLVGMVMQSVLEANVVVDVNMNVRRILEELEEKTGNYYREEINYTAAISNLKSVVENLRRIIKNNELSKMKIYNREGIHKK